MVKKIKRFIVFCLFSLFFSLLSGKIEKGNNRSKNENCWNSAEAGKCCAEGYNKLCGGECCNKSTCCGNSCCDKCNDAGDACY